LPNGNEAGSGAYDPNDPNAPQGGAAASSPASAYQIPLTPATFPNFIPGYSNYANLGAQMQDTMGMPSRYAQGWTWGNGAGRYAFGSGAPYGDPSGRNAPWYVTGANGQGGGYPNPGTTMGQGQSQVPAGQPGAFTGGGLLNPGSPNGVGTNTGIPGGSGLLTGGAPGGGQAPVGAPPAGMSASQAAMKQAMNQKQSQALSLMPQYQAQAPGAAQASFLAQHPMFTQQAMLKGLLSPQTINGLMQGGAPYVRQA
jgi:hypothetical protein